MSDNTPPGPKVSVVGGSIGGLCAGVALHAIGCDVDVYERRSRSLSSQGAAIVVQPDLLRLIEGDGVWRLPITACSHRRTVDADGGLSSRTEMPQTFTSWEAIHGVLRTLFPADRYHLGADVQVMRAEPDAVQLSHLDGSTTRSDLLVLADGARSRLQGHLGLRVAGIYAGYVAWRGTVAERLLAARTRAFFDDAFVFCDARDGGHALAYHIPGDGASTAPGARRLNWVWYETILTGPKLDEALTDRDGHRRVRALPPGAMSDAAVDALRERAATLLDARFAEAIAVTPEPFLQAIEDQAVDRMVAGRTVLLGDAAFVVRPHTAGATAKAAGDAMALASALKVHPGDIDGALAAYGHARLPVGRSMTGYGIALGRRSVTL